VATFAVSHGGGRSAWDWHLVGPELHERRHESIAVDLPTEEGSAGWWAYADAVVDAVRERKPVIVVGHSLGGFTAPLVCVRISVDLLVLVAAMIPCAGERVGEWRTNVGYEDSGFDDVFYHDVTPELAAKAQRRERDEQAEALREQRHAPGGAGPSRQP
jgi:pimeloyl-ACP methyl ester carboxylesterase